MAERNRKPGVQEACRVKRHLKLQHLDDDGVRAITEVIRRQSGVDRVELCGESRRLDIAYDASLLQFGQLTEIPRKHGVEPQQGCWARLRASWYHFTDQNIRDNGLHEPHCCNKAPPRK